MDLIFSITLSVHILVGIALIGLVLLQQGKGADMGAAFGSGASGSLFGATGASNFMSRTTAILATMFFLTSLTLAYIASNQLTDQAGSVIDTVQVEKPITATAAKQPAEDSKSESNVDSKARNIPK